MRQQFFLRAVCGLMVFLIFTVGFPAQAQPQKPNLQELRKQIELFETILNQSLTQAFGGPFDTLVKARGAYLPGYGTVFTFEVSLSPLRNLGPFSALPTPKTEQAAREEEQRRRDKAETVAEQVLANFGQTLSQLPPNESVAIVIQAVAARPNKVERSTIVLSSGKQLIDERQANLIDQTQFVKKLTVTSY